jgi:Ca2+/Na+ antiporter
MVKLLQRVGLVSGMTLATLNIWTGAPLIGLMVGSRLTGDEQISMLAVAGTAVTMLGVGILLIWLLALMGAKHDELTGRTATVRRHTPWLRSMSGEREHGVPGAQAQITALEYLLVTSVVLAVVAFEVWFFFFSGSPFDQRSGR